MFSRQLFSNMNVDISGVFMPCQHSVQIMISVAVVNRRPNGWWGVVGCGGGI